MGFLGTTCLFRHGGYFALELVGLMLLLKGGHFLGGLGIDHFHGNDLLFTDFALAWLLGDAERSWDDSTCRLMLLHMPIVHIH